MKHEQLNLVFADRPQGGQTAEVPDLLGTAKARLHKAEGKEFERFVTGTNPTGLGAAACAVWLRDNIQRAGCVIRQSGSERGAVVQTTAPTRRALGMVMR